MKSTVITHFYNEEYLLPWWLNHHTKIFDQGILIDHNSTDKSIEICKRLAPHWKIYKTNLDYFDAWLNDFEVMTYEKETTGWKIALNVTEFLVSSHPLTYIQNSLMSIGKKGVACSGYIMVDENRNTIPSDSAFLVEQKSTGIDENFFNKRWKRRLFNLQEPTRNRFFHMLPTGIYSPGRHTSHHPDWGFRSPNLLILHYAYSPWCTEFIERKLQIKSKIPVSDTMYSWGMQHLRNANELELDYLNHLKMTNVNLMNNNFFKSGLQLIKNKSFQSDLNFQIVKNR